MSLELLFLGNSNMNSDHFIKSGKIQLTEQLSTGENTFINLRVTTAV